jgi:hypothetical protein
MRTAAIAGVLAVMLVFISSSAGAASPRTLMLPTGAAAGDQLGSSVSGAGDVNGDGYADVIVGAWLNDAGGAGAGRAYVYYGGPAADAVADWTLTGEAAGDGFGTSVSGAGDVNGDGYDDVIVGARLNDAGGTSAGRAYVYYGGPAADTVADLTLTGAATFDAFGGSVSGAGDVNGDGYADVIVGASAAVSGAGRAYVYYGSPSANSVVDLTLTGAAAGDNFGTSVSGAGDVNKDGYADLIVGAHLNDVAGTDAGRAYVYYGGPGADAVPDLTVTGAAASDNFGASVSGAGDVNGDGSADVIVGALWNDAGGASAGRAYVYYGGPAADAVADLTLTGAAPGDQLGSSVSGAGDVNLDGYADVLVGAQGNDAGNSEAGRAYLYHGGPGADAVADLILTEPAATSFFGGSVSDAGDVDGDGYPDVVVGAFGNDVGGADAGQARVITSRPYAVRSPNGGEQWVGGTGQHVRWLGADPADLWISFDGGAGYSLLASSVGGGEQNELLVTAPSHETATAKVRVSVTGEPLTHSSSDASDGVFSIVVAHDPPAAAHRLQHAFAGAAADDKLGASVSDAGDVNGDGYADVIIGSFGDDSGGPEAGRANLYYGGPASDTVADIALFGDTAGDNFGISVSGAGDVNGDGHGDVIVGAWLSSLGGVNAGSAYVYYGGPAAGMVTSLAGSETFGSFGFSVSGAGDVNGDGYADVIVGAFGEDGGGFSGRGRASGDLR